MRPIIHSQKHYVQITRSQVATVARNNEDLCISTATPTGVDDVKEGAIVKAIYVELWVLDNGNDGSNIVTLMKTTNVDAGPTFTEMNALGTFPNKKNILFTHQGLSPNDGVGNPVMVMRDWYKIPKSKQRMGLSDRLVLSIANNGTGALDYCGFVTYKEYD